MILSQTPLALHPLCRSNALQMEWSASWVCLVISVITQHAVQESLTYQYSSIIYYPIFLSNIYLAAEERPPAPAEINFKVSSFNTTSGKGEPFSVGGGKNAVLTK